MEKINFNQVRGFSDSITLTFNFIKQEFKPLLRSFAVDNGMKIIASRLILSLAEKFW